MGFSDPLEVGLELEPKLQEKIILLYKGLKIKVYRCYLIPLLPAWEVHTTKHGHVTAAEETRTALKWQELPDQGPSCTDPACSSDNWMFQHFTGWREKPSAQPASLCSTHLWCWKILQTSFSKLQELPGCYALYLRQLCCDELLEIKSQTKSLHANFQKKTFQK